MTRQKPITLEIKKHGDNFAVQAEGELVAVTPYPLGFTLIVVSPLTSERRVLFVRPRFEQELAIFPAGLEPRLASVASYPCGWATWHERTGLRLTVDALVVAELAGGLHVDFLGLLVVAIGHLFARATLPNVPDSNGQLNPVAMDLELLLAQSLAARCITTHHQGILEAL